MGIFSNWEEDSYREEYLKEECNKIREDLVAFGTSATLITTDGEIHHVSINELEDLFRPCTKEDPCGACALCCEEERGSV